MAAVAVKSLCECYFVNKEYLRPFSQTLHSDTDEGGVRLYFFCIFTAFVFLQSLVVFVLHSQFMDMDNNARLAKECLNSLANTFEWLYTRLSHVNCQMSY